MDKTTATLIAASIAAIASFISIFANKASEFRAAHRKTLSDYIHDLSKTLHQVVATSDILTKTNTDENWRNWKEKSEDAKKKLKEMRPELRYTLWGLDYGFKMLSRLPDWVVHAQKYPKHEEKIVTKGAKIASTLDKCIRKSYQKGRPPRFYEVWKVNRASKKFEEYYNEFQEFKKQNPR